MRRLAALRRRGDELDRRVAAGDDERDLRAALAHERLELVVVGARSHDTPRVPARGVRRLRGRARASGRPGRRAGGRPGGRPAASPGPSPSPARPPLTSFSAAGVFAVTVTWRVTGFVTPGPSRISVVAAAASVSATSRPMRAASAGEGGSRRLRPLTTISPSPAISRTRAMLVLRRPVP